MKKIIGLISSFLLVMQNYTFSIKTTISTNITQNYLPVANFDDWSDNGYDFKIAIERYVLNSKELPKNIFDQLKNDERNNQKSFSEDALNLKYLNDEQRENFFWIEDNQIQNSKGQNVKWWDKNDRHYGTKISVTNQQREKVKKALTYEKQKIN